LTVIDAGKFLSEGKILHGLGTQGIESMWKEVELGLVLK
jgi:hypothetical protein